MNLEIFKNEDIGEIRTLMENGEIWFIAKDISNILEYSETSVMLRRLDDDESIKIEPTKLVGANSMARSTTVINESGLYNAIIGSKKPEAKAFKKWITSEVIPSIRKNGGYIIEKENDTPEEIMARALIVAQETLKRRGERIKALEIKAEEDEPLVTFANGVANTSDAIDIGTFSKLVNDENINVGRNKLFKFLRDNKFLMKKNIPYQKYIDNGYFKTVEQVFKTPYGDKLNVKTLITGVGQIKIINKLKEEFGVILKEES